MLILTSQDKSDVATSPASVLAVSARYRSAFENRLLAPSKRTVSSVGTEISIRLDLALLA